MSRHVPGRLWLPCYGKTPIPLYTLDRCDVNKLIEIVSLSFNSILCALPEVIPMALLLSFYFLRPPYPPNGGEGGLSFILTYPSWK